MRLLAPHLEDEDHLALLGGAIHKSKRDVLKLLAGWFPSADVPSSIRKLPARDVALVAPPRVPASAIATEPSQAPSPSASVPTSAPAGLRTVPESHRPVVAPLAAERYRLQVTIDEDAHTDLRCLQDLMRREFPDGDAAAIVARALRALRREAEKKAFAATPRPRPARATRPDSRHIPAAVAREVWARDEGQCAFEGTKARCPERSCLQFHHATPWIVGGPSITSDISLRCPAHNIYEWDVYSRPIRAAMGLSDGNSFRNEIVIRGEGGPLPGS